MEPVRCFSCNKVLGHLYEKYRTLCQTQAAEDVMNHLKLSRWCCRRMMLTSVDLSTQVNDFNAVHSAQPTPYVTFKTETVPASGRTYICR